MESIFHCFRHTFATLQVSEGTDIYTVSHLLTHANVGTTQIYADIVDKTKRKAVERIRIEENPRKTKKQEDCWKYVWHPEDPKEYYHFETLECLYHYEFGKRNLLDRFGPMFCRSDIINYGNLHDIDFKRTQTLCQGGQMCDFCFIRHRKGEVWERTKSI